MVAQHGIEDGQQLAHRGDESEAGRFAGVAQTSVEALECRVVLDGDEAAHIEGGPDFDAASLDFALAAVAAAVPVDWIDTGPGRRSGGGRPGRARAARRSGYGRR
jgi:hypothetical protein